MFVKALDCPGLFVIYVHCVILTTMKTLESYLADLVAFKSDSNNKEVNKELVDWIANQLEGSFTVSSFEHNGFSSIVAMPAGVKKVKVLLASHCDVVPGKDSLFEMKEQDGKLFGRGVYDMKFAIACFLKFVEDESEHIADLDMGIIITSDEEIGGMDGSRFLVEQGYNADYVFLPDGGGEWSIQDRAKGAAHLIVKSQGSTAHGSRPWEGKSANKELIHFLHKLHDFFIENNECHDEKHEHNTINIGAINGGHAVNQVSEYAEAQIDIRHVAETPYEEIIEYINGLLESHPDITIETGFYRAPLVTDLISPDIVAYKKLVKSMYGIDIKRVMAHGDSDANFFSEAGANVLLTRPLGGDPHGEGEWIDKESLNKFYKLMKAWIFEVAKK